MYSIVGYSLSLSLSLSLSHIWYRQFIVVVNDVALFIITEDDDWNIVVIETRALASSWEQLVIYLGLPFDLIDNTIRPASNCWSEALKQWIKQNYNTKKFGQPSWRTLLRAVAQVNKLQFKKLAEKHRGMMWT